MDNTKLDRRLRSVGKQAFVRCFWPLRAYAHGTMSKSDCTEAVISHGFGGRPGAGGWRIPTAARIFRAGREVAALEVILGSRHPDVASVHGQAQRILDCLRSQIP